MPYKGNKGEGHLQTPSPHKDLNTAKLVAYNEI
jgi:hypothetical protein